jgi:hypothetical protein
MLTDKKKEKRSVRQVKIDKSMLGRGQCEDLRQGRFCGEGEN